MWSARFFIENSQDCGIIKNNMDIMMMNIANIGENPLAAGLFLLKYLGMPLFLIGLIIGAKIIWLNSRQNKYAETLEYTLLAIDIPKENEQSPKAVENMFDQIAGAHSSIGRWDKWVKGAFQSKFSFEIVSIEGNVQFLVYTEKRFRDLIEAATYAQYPDAEITEVEDYTDIAPTEFPNEDYKLWGSEFIESSNWVYPIQTYPFFEHSLSQELKDPMAALMEIMSSLRKGENVWLQYVVTMQDYGWDSKSKREINKILGRSSGQKKGFLDGILFLFTGWINELIDQMMGNPRVEGKPVQAETKELNIMNLTPGEQEKIKAIESKMGKIGFNTKMRLIYFAPKGVYSAPRCVSATVGAIKQFAGPFNGLMPESKHTRTSDFLFFHEKRFSGRQRNIVNAFKQRSNSLGVAEGFILNSEELATVFHFPLSTVVRAPLVKKVESKKAEPPGNLPQTVEIPLKESLEEIEEAEFKEVFAADTAIESQEEEGRRIEKEFNPPAGGEETSKEPPENLPIA